MKYALIKGAGLNPNDIRMIVIQLRDTFLPSYQEEMIFHEKISNAQLLHWSEDAKAHFFEFLYQLIQQKVKIFAWNFLGYELRCLTDHPDKLIRDNVIDIFKIIQISKNQMVSFYSIQGIRNDSTSLRFLNAATFGVEVQHIPIWIQNSRNDLVQDYLTRYLNQLNILVDFWLKSDTLTISASHRTGDISIKLDELWETYTQYLTWINAIYDLPEHCLQRNLR